jgi:two-component system, LytTR family, sensor kinase
MKLQVPVKSLVRLNLLQSIVIGLFVFTYLAIFEGLAWQMVFFCFFIMFKLIALGFINILLLKSIRQRGGTISALKLISRRYLLSCLCGFVLILCMAPLRPHIDAPNPANYSIFQRLILSLIESVVTNMIIVIMQNFILLQHEKSFSDQENAQLKIANVEATNLLLRQQIHPHFLFNALNSLKNLYRTDVDSGENYLVHLADFLRASVSSTEAKVVRLEEELRLCRDYLEMQCIRFGDGLRYGIEVPDEIAQKGYVPAFSIQPLLENAIKHNELTIQTPLFIRIYVNGDRVEVENNLQLKRHPTHSTGKGLLNLITRYKILSGDEVMIVETKYLFSVGIKILKNENSNH